MYDLIIRNGTVLDGSGKEGYCADIAVKDGKIVRIGTKLTDAVHCIDASGLVVTPGFVDSHSHSDEDVFDAPDQKEKVEQGITTSIGGQCGGSLFPTPEETAGVILEKACKVPQGANVAIFVGHSQLRQCVLGMENRAPTAQELEKMKALLRDGIEHGALGVSFGLIYTPGCYAQTPELIELAKVAGEYGALVAAHIRNEADHLEESVQEVIDIVKAASVRGVISHHKAMFRGNHGKVRNTLEMIRKANEEGAEIYCDVYPYIASSTALEARFIPGQYRQGGEKVVACLRDPKLRQQIKAQNLEKWGEDLSWVQINACATAQYQGKTLDRIAQIRGKDQHETVFDLLVENGGHCSAAFFAMCEADVELVMGYDRTMICTDAANAKDSTVYHPRLRGSFPRVLGRYVRERQVVSLPEMIRKMTALPAQVYGLRNKGRIAEGFDADLCVFDPETILDHADFQNCHLRAEGLHYVIVNGKIAAKQAVFTGERAGSVLVFPKEREL